jgi:PhzF family phenazine biosynthesis protein
VPTTLALYHVDAFTSAVFGGNPAAVCPLDAWLPDETLHRIAAENNLSETAFFVRTDDGRYELRWLTPTTEVDLCGHATLATAFILRERLGDSSQPLRFMTRSGELPVTSGPEGYTLDFPRRPAERVAPVAALTFALGAEPEEVWKARDHMCVFTCESEVRALVPDMGRLQAVAPHGVIVTAPADPSLSPGADFVSRFFAPAIGVSEDPVTGSTHCTLAPFWAERLDRTVLQARQVSARGGEMRCALRDDRVLLTGQAVCYLEGTIHF